MFGRVFASGIGPFAPSKDEDVDYQARLLGTAKVAVMSLAQTSASLFADGFDAATTKRMSAAAGVRRSPRRRRSGRRCGR